MTGGLILYGLAADHFFHSAVDGAGQFFGLTNDGQTLRFEGGGLFRVLEAADVDQDIEPRALDAGQQIECGHAQIAGGGRIEAALSEKNYIVPEI